MNILCLKRAALAALLVLGACTTTSGGRAPAALDLGPTSDPAFLIGEYPLAAQGAVLDGDTIKVEGLDSSMRLLCIDTEETFKKDEERQAFERGWESYLAEMKGTSKRPVKMATPAGMAAWEWARKIFEGSETVRLERDHPGEVRDFYNRYLAYVFVKKDGEWVNFNLEAVRQGWSPYFTKYGRSRRFHEAFVEAQKEARAARRGIWGDEVLHYPDYEERLAWWDPRGEALEAFEKKSEGRNDHVIITRQNSLERLAGLVGKPVVVFAQVGDIREPKSPKAPWIVKLAKDRFNSFDLVFFDATVLDATGLRDQKSEFVEVSGVVGEYRGKPQLIVKEPSQVKIAVP